MSKKIEFFVSTATSSQKVKKDVQAMQRLLDAKKAKFDTIDVSSDRAELERMWAQADNNKALPQLHIDGKFVGTFDDCQEKEEVGEFEALVASD